MIFNTNVGSGSWSLNMLQRVRILCRCNYLGVKKLCGATCCHRKNKVNVVVVIHCRED